MKKINKLGAALLAAVIAGAALAGCQSTDKPSQTTTQEAGSSMETEQASTQETIQATPQDGGDSKILIAYFAVSDNSDVDAASSASVVMVGNEAKGRISYLAELIGRETGGDLFSIDTATVYPGNGEKLVDYAAEEQDRDERPEIQNHIENLEQYDTIFVGFPTWWYDLPQVMYTFFDEYDFSGKTIIPFNCHNGSRFSSTISTIEELEPGADVITDGFTISERNVAEAEDEVVSWLGGLGF